MANYKKNLFLLIRVNEVVVLFIAVKFKSTRDVEIRNLYG